MLINGKISCKEKHMNENMQRVAYSFLLKKYDVMSGVPYDAENEGSEHHKNCKKWLRGIGFGVGVCCMKAYMPIV